MEHSKMAVLRELMEMLSGRESNAFKEDYDKSLMPEEPMSVDPDVDLDVDQPEAVMDIDAEVEVMEADPDSDGMPKPEGMPDGSSDDMGMTEEELMELLKQLG